MGVLSPLKSHIDDRSRKNPPKLKCEGGSYRTIIMTRDQSVKIGIIGQGYVGLPLAVAFAKKFKISGCDICTDTTENLKEGRSHIQDITDEHLCRCDILIICVPTPLSEDKIPDLGYIKSVCATIKSILRPGQFVILKSTTYPGTTDEVVVPILKETGLVAGRDFGVAYSPERVDPGNKNFPIEKVPTVVGGITPECTEIAGALYGSVMERIVPVRDASTAEAVKMVENIFRNVSIVLVNEMALIFERMGIDTWEVIDAAAIKPYGFMPSYPGPGIGGHCIPLDPYYMSYRAKKYGFIPRFIETSGEIDESMKSMSSTSPKKGSEGLVSASTGRRLPSWALPTRRTLVSPVVVDGKNLFAGEEGVVLLGIGRGFDLQGVGLDHAFQHLGLRGYGDVSLE